MGNRKILDINGLKHFSMTGTGTADDPFLPIHDVNIQDQTSPVIIVPFHKHVADTTLTAATAIDDYVVSVVSSAGMSAGEYMSMYNVDGSRWYKGRILSIATNDITLDTPIDFEYQIGDKFLSATVNMNVNGSVTPQIFNLRGEEPGIPTVGDITRIIFIMETSTTPEWNKFGDITALVNGLVLRRTDGTYQNIFNIKSNAELAAIMYDLEFLELAKFGVAGVKGRLTFAGQNKIGVTIRLSAGEDLEFIVQDDLTGILKFNAVAEGHVVI